MSYTTLEFDVQDSVAQITLNRPQNANTVDHTLGVELHDVARRCAGDSAIRAALLAANGPIFCAGGDLDAFATLGSELPQGLESMLQDFHPAVETLCTMNAPVVAAVQGMAAGVGLSLVLSCSFAIATENARFTMAYTGVGLTPDGSSTYFLPRIVGLRRAEELMLTNRQLSAQEALDWGIINQVVDDTELMEKALKTAQRLAQGPTGVFGNVRSMLLHSFDNTLHDQLKMEGDSIVAASGSAEGQEGITAFVEKRRPVFSG